MRLKRKGVGCGRRESGYPATNSLTKYSIKQKTQLLIPTLANFISCTGTSSIRLKRLFMLHVLLHITKVIDVGGVSLWVSSVCWDTK